MSDVRESVARSLSVSYSPPALPRQKPRHAEVRRASDPGAALRLPRCSAAMRPRDLGAHKSSGGGRRIGASIAAGVLVSASGHSLCPPVRHD